MTAAGIHFTAIRLFEAADRAIISVQIYKRQRGSEAVTRIAVLPVQKGYEGRIIRIENLETKPNAWIFRCKHFTCGVNEMEDHIGFIPCCIAYLAYACAACGQKTADASELIQGFYFEA